MIGRYLLGVAAALGVLSRTLLPAQGYLSWAGPAPLRFAPQASAVPGFVWPPLALALPARSGSKGPDTSASPLTAQPAAQASPGTNQAPVLPPGLTNNPTAGEPPLEIPAPAEPPQLPRDVREVTPEILTGLFKLQSGTNAPVPGRTTEVPFLPPGAKVAPGSEAIYRMQ